MRFFIVRHEQTCQACGSTMMPGEEGVVIIIKVGEGRMSIPHTFHAECFPQWNKAMYAYRLEQWRQSRDGNHRKVKPKMGRPRKYVNPILANNLSTKIRYHLCRGNIATAERLQVELSDLRA